MPARSGPTSHSLRLPASRMTERKTWALSGGLSACWAEASPVWGCVPHTVRVAAPDPCPQWHRIPEATAWKWASPLCHCDQWHVRHPSQNGQQGRGHLLALRASQGSQELQGRTGPPRWPVRSAQGPNCSISSADGRWKEARCHLADEGAACEGTGFGGQT